MRLILAAVLSQPASGASADEAQGGRAVIKQDISIKGGASGPVLPIPKPGPDRAVVDETIDSLKIMSREHAARAASVRVPGSEKLSRPFPGAPYLVFSPRSVSAPYDLWTFEVIEGPTETLMRQDGTGKVVEPIEWDGSGPAGDDAVRVGRTYFFRFTGRRGPESFILTSEPVTLKSLAVREYLGGTRLEVSNAEVWQDKKARLKPGAEKYLAPMADRMRRLASKENYKVELHQPQPESALAKDRADALRRWFAEALLINAARVTVSVQGDTTRGSITASLLPADRGEAIRDE
jgi:hypothetical protein